MIRRRQLFRPISGSPFSASNARQRAIRAAIAILVLIAAGEAAAAGGFALRAPWPIEVAGGQIAGGQVTCSAWPDPIVSLATGSRYADADPTRSQVDPDKSAAYEAQIAPVRAYARRVVSWSNAYLLSGGSEPRAARCAIDALRNWAAAGALHDAATPGANFNRATFLSSIASAYTQIRGYPGLGDADRATIEGWIGDLATLTRAFYQKRRDDSDAAHNNIQDWAALGVAMAGVATGDRDDFAWGMEGLRRGVCAARPDGDLPQEIARRSRALEYHLFALQPLVMLAELGQVNGQDAYEMCGGALHRIVAFALDAVDDRSRIEALAGVAQEDVGPLKSNGDMAWLEIYLRRFPDGTWRERLPALRPLAQTNLGGRLSALYGVR